MRRWAMPFWLCFAIFSGTRSHPAEPEPRFILEFLSSSPEEFAGVSGKFFGPFEVLAAIRPVRVDGCEGPESWSIGAIHPPILEILQVSMDGTTAGELLDTSSGFSHLEAIDPEKNGGQHGFVAAAILSLQKPIHLPPDRIGTVVSATYRGVHPDVTAPEERVLEFSFVDGLVGSSQPVVNTITCGGENLFPDFLSFTRKLKTVPSCNAGLDLALDAPGAVLEGDSGILRIEISAGQGFEIDCSVRLASNLAGPNGPEGWSLSIQHDRSFFEALEATTENTDTEQYADPKQRFLKTEVIDNESGSGFISAVILSLAAPRSLPPQGQLCIARARYRLTAPHDVPGLLQATPIRFQAGLTESEVPVENIFTVEGKTEIACRKRSLLVEVNVVRGGKIFLRSDANNDGRVNISDAIWTIRRLFVGGLESPCPAAADSNGDLQADAADALFLLRYLFLRGEPIPEPFPRCAPDPNLLNPLECRESEVHCP